MQQPDSIAQELLKDREKGSARFMAEYRDRLYSVALALCHDETEAEDLVLRTLERIIEKIGDYQERDSFYNWACVIMLNLYRDSTRGKVGQGTVPVGGAAEMDALMEPIGAERIVMDVDSGIVRQVLERMPEDMREVLLLHYFMDMPVGKIAKFLTQPVGTIKSRLYYARVALAMRLGAKLKKSAVALVAAALLFFGVTAAAVVGLVSAAGSNDGAVAAEAEISDGTETDATAGTSGTNGAVEGDANQEIPPDTEVTDVATLLSSDSTQGEETMNIRKTAAVSLAMAMLTTPTSAFALTIGGGEIDVSLNSTAYVKVMENSGPLAGTWTLTGITAWNGAAQVAFSVVSNRPYASDTLNSGDARLGEMPAGNYVHQLSVFNQWDGSRTRSYRVQLAQPVGGNDIYARVTAVTISQEDVNLVDYPDIRDFKDVATKIAVSYTDNANLANFPVTKLKFKKQTGYIQSNGARDACVNTGYYPGPNTRVEFDFEFTGLDQGAEPFGSWNDASNVGLYCYLGSSSSFDTNPQLSYRLSSATTGNGQSSNAYRVEINHRYCVVVDFSSTAGSFEVWTGGVRGLKNTLAAPNAARSKFPMSIIGANYKSYGSIAYKAYTPKMKVYGCRIYEAGVLVKNFIPCIRGGIPGFKETCAGVFVGGNVASLTTGGDIWTDPDDPYVALDYPGGVGGNLPAGTRLYFSSNDTIGPDSRIEFDYSLLTHTQKSDAFLFDSYGTKRMAVYASGGHYAFTINDSAKYNPADIGDVQYMLTTNSYGIRRTVVLDKDSIRFVTAGFTNAVKTVTSAQSGTNNKFVIGNYGGNLQRSMPMRIYGYRIYNGGVLQKDYRPCVTNGVPGMLDILNNNCIFPFTDTGNVYNRFVAAVGGNIVCTDGSDAAYLEFPGTGEGINTGYKVTPDSCIEADISLWSTVNLTNSVQQLLYQAAGTYVRLNAERNSNGAKLYWQYSNYNQTDYNNTRMLVSNDRMQYSLDNHVLTMSIKRGGETLYITNYTSNANNSSSANRLIVGKANAHMRLYGLKIWEYVNDVKTPVRDFVPCVTNGVAGLYDLCGTGFYPLSGGKVSGKPAIGADEFVTVPQPAKLTRTGTGSTVTLTCFAPSAQSYEWYEDGVLMSGETSDALTLNWERAKAQADNHIHTYSVKPVYEVFNETVRGKAVSAAVEYKPLGTTILIR